MKDSLVRGLNLTALLVFGALWAGLLVVGGAVLVVSARGASTAALLSGGATAVIAGGFVFQVVVADRLFPRVDRRLADLSQASLGLVLVLGIALTALLIIEGKNA